MNWFILQPIVSFFQHGFFSHPCGECPARTPSDCLPFYFWKIIPLVKAEILFSLLRSLHYHAIQCFDSCLHVVSIGSGYDNR